MKFSLLIQLTSSIRAAGTEHIFIDVLNFQLHFIINRQVINEKQQKTHLKDSIQGLKIL